MKSLALERNLTKHQFLKILESELNIRQENEVYAQSEEEFFNPKAPRNFWVRTGALENRGFDVATYYDIYNTTLHKYSHDEDVSDSIEIMIRLPDKSD